MEQLKDFEYVKIMTHIAQKVYDNEFTSKWFINYDIIGKKNLLAVMVTWVGKGGSKVWVICHKWALQNGVYRPNTKAAIFVRCANRHS